MVDNETSDIQRRKNQHIEICLNEDVNGYAGGAGFDRYRFRHNALPETDFAAIDTSCELFGRALKVPLLISSMTGGTGEAARINRRLAQAAQRHGWAMGLGSMRAAIEHPTTADSFRVRDVAPDIPLLANIGAVQLNYGFGAQQCMQAIELTGADALVLHLNGLQEVFQPEGDTRFGGLLKHIEQVCRALPVPVGIKEVGWGIDGETAQRLVEAGVQFIDVAGAGGTSWSEVEKLRSADLVRRKAADAFTDWGTTTVDCIREVREAQPGGLLIGSGGLFTGVDAAKAIALGADLAGFGRSLLASAVDSVEEVEQLFERIELELRAAMFGIGASSLSELRGTPRLIRVG